ncbi:MAG: TetR/AcrR family transcriptional regulator [Dysgonamonadaceae bacterium]|jgi:AcrR family transcriptional regulator|nr:TetR/AcrR family transcriptional regulator [Dysgonamonadaceae bacterium]
MAKTKDTEAIDASTEEKIKNAARTVFQKKGYAATRTRDIAEEAGINLALLNYYFRSKEKLFEIIMFETIQDFIKDILSVYNDKNTNFEKKLEHWAVNYIDMCIKNPNVPMFILSEVRNRPEDLLNKIPARQLFTDSVFTMQFKEKVAAGEINEPNLLQFVINVIGLAIFPFIGQPFLSIIGGLNNDQFYQLMQERKKLIPVWIKKMFFTEKYQESNNFNEIYY